MNNWLSRKIKDFGKVVTGKTPPTEDNEFYDKGYKFVTPTDLDFNSYYIRDTERNVSEKARNRYPNYFLPPDSVSYTCIGATIGKSCLNREYVLTNQQINSIIPNKTSDARFIYYYLNAITPSIVAVVGGAAIPIVNKSSFENIKISLPPLLTQKKIGKVLSNYDDLIENNLKRINLLEESSRLTYEEWFLRFRIDGKKLDIDTASDLPFGWKKKSVTECDSFKQDKRKIKKFKGEKKYYATADVTETVITADGETINWDNKPSRAQIKPNNNTVWFARMSDTYKVLCFNNKNINLQENSILSSGFVGFKAKNRLCLPFLYFTINSKFFHELKDLYATGATQVSLNNDSMSFIKIIEPSADLVEEFGRRTLPFIEEISILRNKNQLLKEARDILLPRLMTGIIDTNDMDTVE
jgi:type I restriction enzyme, S subunit